MSDTKKKAGLSEFFEGLTGLIDLVAKLQEQEDGSRAHSGEFKSPSGLSGVWGVRIKAGTGGAPTFDHFGNIGSNNKGGVVNEEREPIMDIFEDGNTLTVVTELPGASEDSIDVTIDGTLLTISASARDRKYHKEATLPCQVSCEPLKRSYLNGIFSLVLACENQPAFKA